MIYTSSFTKIDMHVHTRYTYSSSISLKDIESFLHKHPDFGLAITDVNYIDGALMLQEKYPDRIIVGSQIITRHGAITGLFLKSNIPGGKDLNWTIDAILVQDGLVYIPHPLDRLRKTRLARESLSLALKRCDIVEIFNSRTMNEQDNKASVSLIRPNVLPACGSDAHTKQELGLAYVSMKSGVQMTSSGFYDALHGTDLFCRKTKLLSMMHTKVYTGFKNLHRKR